MQKAYELSQKRRKNAYDEHKIALNSRKRKPALKLPFWLRISTDWGENRMNWKIA